VTGQLPQTTPDLKQPRGEHELPPEPESAEADTASLSRIPLGVRAELSLADQAAAAELHTRQRRDFLQQQALSREHKPQPERFLSWGDLFDRGLVRSKTQARRLWEAGKMPRPVHLSPRVLAFRQSEIESWASSLQYAPVLAAGGKRRRPNDPECPEISRPAHIGKDRRQVRSEEVQEANWEAMKFDVRPAVATGQSADSNPVATTEARRSYDDADVHRKGGSRNSDGGTPMTVMEDKHDLNEITNEPRQVESDQAQRDTRTEEPHEVTIEEPTNTPPSSIESTEVIALSDRDALWQGYCRLAVALHRRGNAAEFKTDLLAGQIPTVTDTALMQAALALVAGMSAAGVKRWNWLPAPTRDELADPEAWAARRLIDRRAAQDAEGSGRWDAQVARALRQPPTAKGTINPVHLQQSKYDLAELARRLEWTIAKHKAERGDFKREWLDHRSQHYISDAAGGISNKQVSIMAGEITGSRSRREFDANWKIVTDWLRERQAESRSD
jgi:predicted DNA-binding transcriptional regulator AlpA